MSSTQIPAIYGPGEHNIALTSIDRDALFVLKRLADSGHTAYLVGGGVRDLLFSRKPKDFDISTSARPDQVRKLFRHCLIVGKRFRLAHVRFGPKVIEVSTFRAGDPESDALILHDNCWGTPEQDVLRRDFTINGLFYNPITEEIIDYVGGFADVSKRRLVTIGPAEVRFRQDPVRMIRLLKFQARFDLEVDDSASQALWRCAAQIKNSAPARVLEELLRMLESGASHPFFMLLMDSGVLKEIYPKMAQAFQDREGSEMFRSLKAVDVLQNHAGRPRVSLQRATIVAALTWPIYSVAVQQIALAQKKAPDLAQLTELAEHLLSSLFQGFGQLPRMLRQAAALALAHQYRLTPMEGMRGNPARLKGEDRQNAMSLLKIRGLLHPELLKQYNDIKQRQYRG